MYVGSAKNFSAVILALIPQLLLATSNSFSIALPSVGRVSGPEIRSTLNLLQPKPCITREICCGRRCSWAKNSSPCSLESSIQRVYSSSAVGLRSASMASMARGAECVWSHLLAKHVLVIRLKPRCGSCRAGWWVSLPLLSDREHRKVDCFNADQFESDHLFTRLQRLRDDADVQDP